MLLDTRDCRLLVFLAGDGNSVGLSRAVVSNDPLFWEEKVVE